jgi:ABC-type transport system involved in multi-copper enzyme maturation permease subunit
MGIDVAHYRPWNGKLRSPWMATLAIVRVALTQVFRRKAYWFVFALGLFNFLLFWAIIYAITQFDIPPDAQKAFLERFGFSPEATLGQENGYLGFIDRQSLVVMILLAFSGSLLVGGDFRLGLLPFYLSRRLDRRHYVVGKLLAISAIIALLTAVPALLLFLEYGMFTGSLDYWIDNWRVAASVVGYTVVMCVVLSIWLTALSAYLQRAAPIVITWASLFVLLRAVATQMSRSTGDKTWELLDPWRDIRFVGKLLFGLTENAQEVELGWWAAGILAGTCAIALLALARKVRAVEIVT